MSTTGFKDRLMDTLRGAVQNFNDSGDPNAAVVKAARDNDFNPEQTTRLCEAFNTARTLYHYKSANDRTSTFSLADAGAVLTELFEKQDQPQAKCAAVGGYGEYDQRERSYHDHDRAEKAASSELPQPQESGLSMEAIAGQAMRALRGMRQTVKIAEDEARMAASNAATALTKLARMLTLGYADVVVHDSARLIAGYSKQAEWVPVMAKFAEFLPARATPAPELVAKYARHAVIDDTELDRHIDLLKEARDWMEIEAEMLASAGIMAKEADEFEREWLEAVNPALCDKQAETLANFIRPEVVKAAATEATQKYKTRNMYGEPVEVTSTSGSDQGQPGISDSVSGFLGDAVKKPLSSIMDTGVQRMISEPMGRENKALSEKLKNVQRQIMLQDLMTNDPVLAEETPETVAEAYNAILQMAPEMASNKEVVRAVLRQTVHSVAVSPYDAEIWTKLEKNLQNIRGKGVPMRGSEDK